MQNTSSFLSTSIMRKFGKTNGGMSRNKSSKKKTNPYLTILTMQ